MSQTITIAPVSRIEGHGRITIRLDDHGQVEAARLHVHELRGFEAFCVGRPYWEMPLITARICGICPVSHALTAAAACEQIMGLEPPPAARLLRRILTLAQLILSHSLSFFHLSGPDIIMGLDTDPAERNIVGLARLAPELIRKAARLRQIGQQIVNRVGGGHLHPEQIIPGGMSAPLTSEDRDAIAALMPEALELIHVAELVWEEHRKRFLGEMGDWPEQIDHTLGLVDSDGYLDHGGGTLRFRAEQGGATRDIAPDNYGEAINETTSDDSYMKGTVCRLGGGTAQTYRVGPSARLHTAPLAHAPGAEAARQAFLADSRLSASSIGNHRARLIEMLYATERISAMITDPACIDTHVMNRGQVQNLRGVGITEAPRGVLIHDYRVDQTGLLTGVNLIVATGHNSVAMDRTITAIARRHLHDGQLTEGLLNRIEHGIRLYDPCLSCATHLHGRSGISITLFAANGTVLDQV